MDRSVGDAGAALGRLGQIALPVQGLDRAVAFYRDTLRAPFLFRAPDLAFFACDGVRLMLSRPERPEDDHAGSVLYCRLDDLPAAHADLSARGVAVLDAPHLIAAMPDHDLWMAFFADGEGNTHALMSEVPRP